MLTLFKDALGIERKEEHGQTPGSDGDMRWRKLKELKMHQGIFSLV